MLMRLMAVNATPPNMRVQRTRVLLPAVARRSPLTRGPLGGQEKQ
jgi:hypothetical protein